jgi:hypothetical protein
MYVADMVTVAQAMLCYFGDVGSMPWRMRNTLVFNGNCMHGNASKLSRVHADYCHNWRHLACVDGIAVTAGDLAARPIGRDDPPAAALATGSGGSVTSPKPQPQPDTDADARSTRG